MKKIYPGIDSLNYEERRKLLEDNSYEVGEENVRRHFTKDEIITMKDSLANSTIEKLAAETELKVLAAPLKGIIKQKTEAIKNVSTDIHNGYYENREKVYYIADHLGGFMHCYDSLGTLLHSRPFTEREKQHKLKIAN